MNMRRLFLLYVIGFQSIAALELMEADVPAAISFLIADLKYSREHGVKICEVQHGLDSTFYGDRFSHGEPGLISANLLRFLREYQSRFWTYEKGFTESAIRSLIAKAPDWRIYEKLSLIETDPLFMERRDLAPSDPFDVKSYQGLLVARTMDKRQEGWNKQYSGILAIDTVSAPYWNDKYKMTKLLCRNERLASLKPRWNLYKKIYTPGLAKKIMDEFQCDRFVIKPLNAYLGYGVLIVDRENLDDTLRYILGKSRQLKEDADRSYFYWFHDTADSFLVEEFYPSDPIEVPHLNNDVYQPTMRVAFLMVYTNRRIKTHFLGYYWLVPEHPLFADVPLTKKHKAEVVVPYFCAVDPETEAEVQPFLEEAFPLLFKEMLIDYSPK